MRTSEEGCVFDKLKVRIPFSPLLCPPSPLSFLSSVCPEGTLMARDSLHLAFSFSFLSPSLSSSVKLRGVKLEPRPIQQVSWRIHTHARTHTHRSLLLLPNLASSLFHLGLSPVTPLPLLSFLPYLLFPCFLSFYPLLLLNVPWVDT